MPRVPRAKTLSKLLRSGQPVILSGPYGSLAAERAAQRIAANPQGAHHIPFGRTIGVGLFLFTKAGRTELEAMATEYARAVPRDQPHAVVTPTYRIQHKTLNREAQEGAVNPNLPGMGLQAVLHAERIAVNAIKRAGRRRENTPIFMSIGTPFDSYVGEATPHDVVLETLPQVFAAVRFAHHVDNIMFETVPSLDAAVAAARAFKLAHDKLNIREFSEETWSPKLQQYLGLTPDLNVAQGVHKQTIPSYDPETGTYEKIKPTKT